MGNWLKYQVKGSTKNTNGISLQRDLSAERVAELEVLFSLNSNLLNLEKTSDLGEEVAVHLNVEEAGTLKSHLDKYIVDIEHFSYSLTHIVEQKIKSSTKVSNGLIVLVDPDRYRLEIELLLELASGVTRNMNGVGYVVTLNVVEATDLLGRLEEFISGALVGVES